MRLIMAGLESFDYSIFSGGRRLPEFVTTLEATAKHKDPKKRRTTGQAWNAQHKNTSRVVKHPLPKR